MTGDSATAPYPGVTLEAVLRAREARARLQQSWLLRFRQPLISATLVWPGEIKDSPLARQTMAAAKQALSQSLQQRQWPVSQHEIRFLPTGPEAFWSLSAPAWMIKHVTVHLEETHPLGRLWDLDVFCPTAGLIKRSAIHQPMRRCFICDEPAHVCSRMRRHSAQTLTRVIEEVTCDYFRSQR